MQFLFISQFTPGDAALVLLIVLTAFLLLISFEKKKALIILFNCAIFLLWLVMPLMRFAFSIWNFFAGIVNRILNYEVRMKLTPDEEAELNENVFDQPLGI